MTTDYIDQVSDEWMRLWDIDHFFAACLRIFSNEWITANRIVTTARSRNDAEDLRSVLASIAPGNAPNTYSSRRLGHWMFRVAAEQSASDGGPKLVFRGKENGSYGNTAWQILVEDRVAA